MKPEQKAHFHKALLSAFPTRSSLARMLSFKLGWELEQLVSSSGLADAVFELIRHAESHGQLQRLLQAAYDENPGNPNLKDFYSSFGSAPPGASSPANVEATQSASSAANPAKKRPLRIVYCHAARDSAFGAALDRHLVSMVKLGQIERPWSPARIPPGADKRRELTQQFERAELILPLVSADFLADCDDYLQLAQARYKAGTRVLPIIVRPTLWKAAWFGELQAYPFVSEKVKPVGSWSEPDDAWMNVIEGIQLLLEPPTTQASA